MSNKCKCFQILQCLLGKMKHRLRTTDIHTVADSAHGYVGADLAALCKEGILRHIHVKRIGILIKCSIKLSLLKRTLNK